MKKFLAAVAIAAAVCQPAMATTFPSLTTIYVGTGVRDSGTTVFTGIATVFNCSNVSGVSAQVRFLVLSSFGDPVGTAATATLAHGATYTAVTHTESTFAANVSLSTFGVSQGVVNIEATQSGVFCNAMITDADTAAHGITLPLVRVNPHPGTVE